MSPLIARKPPIVFRATRKSCDAKDDANFLDFQTLRHRLRKTLHYGRFPTTDRPSLPMTELAVEFFSKAVPDGLGRVDLDYTASVSRNACISPCSMILAMAYIERVRHRSPEYLQHVSSSDLFLVSMMVASKFLYDNGEDEDVFNDEWAASADMEVHEINLLEMNFLRAIDWHLYVDRATFDRLLRRTEFTLSMRKVRERGWATYTEISTVLDAMADGGWSLSTCRQILSEYVLKVIAVGAMAYVASIMTLVGATLVANHVRLLGPLDNRSHGHPDAVAILSESTDHVPSRTTNSSIAVPDDCVELECRLIRNLEVDRRLGLLGVATVSSVRVHVTDGPPHVRLRRPRDFDPPNRILRTKRLPRFLMPINSNWSSLNFHPKTVFFDVCI